MDLQPLMKRTRSTIKTATPRNTYAKAHDLRFFTNMRLNKNFFTYNTDSESILVPAVEAGFSGVVRGNRTLGTILELLAEDTTEEQIVTAMKDRFSAPEGEIERDVRQAITELRRIGALDE